MTDDSCSTFSPLEVAARHPITFEGAAVDFFQGALLGNGGLGAVVTTRPDAVVIRFGHNDVWDIRIAEKNREKIGTFAEVFARVQAIPATLRRLEDDPWYQEYLALTEANYRKPYPRPFPCGSLLLGFDRREAEVLGHHLDIATGLCRVQLLVRGQPHALEVFADRTADRLWLRVVDEAGRPVPGPFRRVRLLPDPEAARDMPPYTVPDGLPEATLSFRQVLPAQEPEAYDPAAGDPRDRALRLTVRVSGRLERRTRLVRHDVWEEMGPLERAWVGEEPFLACVQLDHGLASALPAAEVPVLDVSPAAWAAARAASEANWRAYWERSGVRLGDPFLEQIWYWNLYFLHCAVKPGVTCPGLFANWSYRGIGSAWHGDYHMNYNTQQPFWVTFSSNHVEKHLPYVDLVDHLLPVSRRWAREYYGLRGAYFPHSAYPVEMTMLPYPVPTWGWEICETPWTVQSLWWHYLYTMDRDFLARRAFEPIKEAVLFLVDYMLRPEAHGPQWGDDRYHIFPTVPPELYGLKPGFRYNYDCLVDLTLTRFVFQAFLQACRILGREEAEQALIGQVQEILAHSPEYPTAETPEGRVFVSVPGEHPDIVYNVPCSTFTVFPGEEHGLHSPPELYQLAANSYRRQRNEGGNDLVLLNLAGARLGLLDLERFKRQIRYCLLPNGTCTDKALEVDGRYNDHTPFDFMARVGIWFENFALPVVINECLLQSYTGTLRLFPNWPAHLEAEFRTLRAVGAFLVSSRWADGQVEWVEVYSEAGSPLRLHCPWPQGARCQRADGETVLAGPLIELPTAPGERLVLRPAG